ncbi:uncharacterized protein LOC109719616 [Ananas comosus]|uniref:Uncharacterized protein LOC109719616 n=1 Tax=Ananas comosus TaxID=4615 RepID=A0A6P5G858_ANACO|nr:uncharacterized protein LOC109719616 [Ananas comosus]
MEKLRTGDGRKNPKQHSDKGKMKKPVKVVYISNPMKVKAANPAEFRALVQELTGQDSTFPDQSLFPEADADGGHDVPSKPDTTTTFRSHAAPGSSYAGGNPDVVDLRGGPRAGASPFDALDDAF